MKETIKQHTNVLRIPVALSVALGAFALGAALPGHAFADDSEDQDALYEPKVVTVENDPSAPASTGFTSYTKTSGNYKVILCGVTDANKDALADAVFANLKDDGEPIKFVNSDFVDAEKYSTSYEGFDKYHCWLGSTSNILTLTGWASHYTNPLTGKTFSDEDDLFAFMSSGFTDAACQPDRAYSYFFDGLFGGTVRFFLRTTEATLLKPYAGTSQTGFDPKVSSAAFVKRLDIDTNLPGLEALEGLQEHALEMGIQGGTSHSVTITGAVIDESKQGADRYVAVIIADTDNDPTASDTPPSSFEAANAAKSAQINSYTLYHINTGNFDGRTVELVEKYMKYRSDTYIGDFTQVENYSASVRQSALETAQNATCDAKSTSDITLSSVAIFNSQYDEKSSYTTTENLLLRAIIMRLNADVPFDTKTTGHDFLENKIEVYRDGAHVGTIDKQAWINIENGINTTRGDYFWIDLSSVDILRVPGNYTLTFYLNSGGIDEAYVSNNDSPQSVSFTVTDAPAVYRLYNAATGEHLWTADENEYQVLANLGWIQESTAWKSQPSGKAVYRLYNASLDKHLYTADTNEATVLANQYGWTNEGIAYYAVDDSATSNASPVHRLYNAESGQHLLTTDANEASFLASSCGWTDESVAFYVNR